MDLFLEEMDNRTSYSKTIFTNVFYNAHPIKKLIS